MKCNRVGCNQHITHVQSPATWIAETSHLRQPRPSVRLQHSTHLSRSNTRTDANKPSQAQQDATLAKVHQARLDKPAA